MSNAELVKRLRDLYENTVVCHCGQSCKDHNWRDDHNATPREDDDDETIRLSADTIERLEKELAAARKVVEAKDRALHLLMHADTTITVGEVLLQLAALTAYEQEKPNA